MANHPPLGDRSDKLSKESKEAVIWVEAGFNEYADIIGRSGRERVASDAKEFDGSALFYWACGRPYKGGIHKSIRIQTERYGKQFGCVLRDKVEVPEDVDTLQLRRDLQRLMNSKCPWPALALVELMLACTNDYGVTIPDLLFHAVLLDYFVRFNDVPPIQKGGRGIVRGTEASFHVPSN